MEHISIRKKLYSAAQCHSFSRVTVEILNLKLWRMWPVCDTLTLLITLSRNTTSKYDIINPSLGFVQAVRTCAAVLVRLPRVSEPQLSIRCSTIEWASFPSASVLPSVTSGCAAVIVAVLIASFRATAGSLESAGKVPAYLSAVVEFFLKSLIITHASFCSLPIALSIIATYIWFSHSLSLTAS